MKKKNIVLIAVIALVAILVIAFVGTYNGLASSREAVKTAGSDIQTQLQRRNDLVPNLVNTVKGYAAHETAVYDKITEARKGVLAAKTPAEQAAASDALTGALKGMTFIVESNPELKANTNFIQLNDELAGTENRITTARRDLNAAVKTYNTKIVRFPNNLIAGMFGFEKAEYFEAAAGADKVPEVKF